MGSALADRIKCQFNAKIVKQKIFSVEQMPETVGRLNS